MTGRRTIVRDCGAVRVGAPEGFTYVQDFLTGDEQRALLERLRALSYTHDVTRGKPMNRGYAQFGYAHVTKARMVTPAPPLPDFLAALAAKALPHCLARTRFDQCIVTRYPAGAGIGWHPDEDVFDDCIAAVSLAAPARLHFRLCGAKEVSYDIQAAPGSLYVMRGPARWEYQHRVRHLARGALRAVLRHVPERRVERVGHHRRVSLLRGLPARRSGDRPPYSPHGTNGRDGR